MYFIQYKNGIATTYWVSKLDARLCIILEAAIGSVLRL